MINADNSSPCVSSGNAFSYYQYKMMDWMVSYLMLDIWRILFLIVLILLYSFLRPSPSNIPCVRHCKQFWNRCFVGLILVRWFFCSKKYIYKSIFETKLKQTFFTAIIWVDRTHKIGESLQHMFMVDTLSNLTR